MPTIIPSTHDGYQEPDQLWSRALDAIPGRRGRRSTDAQGHPTIKVVCPAHPDKNPSLSVTAGEKRVHFHCWAGCDEDAVLSAIGWTKSETYYEPPRRPDDARGLTVRGVAAKKPSAQPKKAAPAKPTPARSYRTMTMGPLGRPQTLYRYEDAGGELRYVVARYREPNGGKTFRQFTPAPGGEWFRTGPTDTERLLYRLPELRAAIQRGDRIYLVEGEKDADNGNAAGAAGVWVTSAAGGAKAPWQPQYTEELAGAREVVMCADYDEPGRQYAAIVHTELAKAGISLRIVRAIAGKDLSDHLAAGHGFDDLVPMTWAPWATPNDAPAPVTESDSGDGPRPPAPPPGQNADAGDDGGRRRIVPGPRYVIHDGRTYRMTYKRENDVTVQELRLVLGCVVEIEAAITVCTGDDAIDELNGGAITRYKLRATHPDTKETLALDVEPKAWRDGAWLDSLWPSCEFSASRQGRVEAVQAVRQLSPRATRAAVHGSTGWTEIDGQRAYVHAGGAITAERVIPVDVDMPRAVRAMELPEPPTDAAAITAAANESVGLLSRDWLPARIGYVLAGAAYRAILPNAAVVPLLVAPPGSGKTETAIIAAQHFAPSLCHDRKEFVSMADLGATAKAAQAIAHRAADALLIIDDYPPQTTHGNRTDAQSAMIRAAYDRASRETLTHDRQFKAGPGPRCVVLSSAEYAPADQGARERALVVPMPWGSEPPVESIAAEQSRERAAARAGFMAWLIRCAAKLTADELRDWTAAADREYESGLRAAGYTVRSAEHVGRLMTGWAWAAACMVTAGVWTEAERDEFLTGPVWAAAIEAADANSEPDQDASPGARLVRLLREALGSRAHVADAQHPDEPPTAYHEDDCGWTNFARRDVPEWKPQGDRIGWVRGTRVLLHPGTALRVAQLAADAEGTVLAAQSDAAAAQLLDAAGVGLVADPGRRTRQVRIGGRQVRVWDLPAALFWPEDDDTTPERPKTDAPTGPTPPPAPSGPVRGSTPPADAPNLCEVCGEPMRLKGYRTHPTCEPVDGAERPAEAREGAERPAEARKRLRTDWRAAEVMVIDDGAEAILPNGDQIEGPGPNAHAGDVAAWATAQRIGHDGPHGRPEPAHVYLAAECLKHYGLPSGDADLDRQKKALEKSRRGAEFWTRADSDGWQFGRGATSSSWVRLWSSGRGSAVITSTDWLRQLTITGGTDDPHEQIRRLGLWTATTGTPLTITEAVTFRAMGDLPAIELPDLPWGDMATDLMWRRPLEPRELERGYVAAYDRRKSYLAACSTVLASGSLAHVEQPQVDPTRAGFWRVTSSCWDALDFPLPHPQEATPGQRCEWVATPTLALMREQGPVEVAEAWLYDSPSRVMEPAYRRIRAALVAVEKWPDSDTKAALTAGLKASYQRGVGLLAQLADAGQAKTGHRPDVRASIIATHRANSYRQMIMAGARGTWPFVMARNDAVVFAVENRDEWPGDPAGVAPKLGRYKPAGAATMAEFLERTARDPESPSRAVWAVTDPDGLRERDAHDDELDGED